MTHGEHRASRPVGPADTRPSDPPARHRWARTRLFAAACGLSAFAGAAAGASLNLAGTSALYTSSAGTQVNTITAGSWPPVQVPADCGPLSQYNAIIIGSAGNDFIDADDFQPGGAKQGLSTPGLTVYPLEGSNRQIIVGNGGDDLVYSGNGKDCLVGGPGDDILIAGNGPDILLGGGGNDLLIGGHAPDTVVPGPDGNTQITDPCLTWPGLATTKVSCHQKNGNGTWLFDIVPGPTP